MEEWKRRAMIVFLENAWNLAFHLHTLAACCLPSEAVFLFTHSSRQFISSQVLIFEAQCTIHISILPQSFVHPHPLPCPRFPSLASLPPSCSSVCQQAAAQLPNGRLDLCGDGGNDRSCKAGSDRCRGAVQASEGEGHHGDWRPPHHRTLHRREGEETKERDMGRGNPV